MIIGIGVDLVDMRRLKDLIKKYGDRFTERLFTEQERAYAEASNNPLHAYANRFAAKEAAAKALGTGFTGGITWQDIEVRRPMGKAPILCFYANALTKLISLTPQGYTSVGHISFSDEPPYSTAFVILSANLKS